ncbi:hypothetical protein IPF86_03215 [Candidatus Nomurabacteria bacterium]|jgi:hypothetical protein|nr:MAG: hypothetical protein IPF86_03215 [Candidatus Nomurabacteria bacterium]
MKDDLRIKQLEKKFKVKNIGLLTTGLFLEDFGLTIQISDGILDKESLIAPCIVFELSKKPKFRFLSENKFLKSYLTKIGKKNIKEMGNHEYINYIFSSTKNGETREYKKWRENNQKKVKYIHSLISKFNKKRKNPILELTQFEDGVARIDFGADDSLFNKRQKMSFVKKKKLFGEMLNEFGLFSTNLKVLK